jgi:hypothetical protein
MKRKRAPGGGRKPKGEFSNLTSSLTIRIPEDVRKQLESESTASGQSVAQVLLWHLRRSFNRERELEREPAMGALCFLIADLAGKVSGLVDAQGRPAFDWRTDPFFFRAFKLAVAQLLDALEPSGEIEPPEMMLRSKMEGGLNEHIHSMLIRTYETPEARAEQAVRTLLSNLQDATYDPSWLNEVEPNFKTYWRRREYGLVDARRDLELLNPKTTKPEGKGND